MKEMRPEVGDSVVVKEGVRCPDYGVLSLAGCQGRVANLEKGTERSGPMVCIKWDSSTLRSLPEDYVRESEVEGLDWKEMVLSVDDVDRADPRDADDDVEEAVSEISSRHRFDHLDEQGARIHEALADCDPDDDWECMNAWAEHLDSALSFPFEAEISEHQDRGPLRYGDHLKVLDIADVDDLYGAIVDVRKGRHRYAFPLCDLKAKDKESPNCQALDDYRAWFANR